MADLTVSATSGEVLPHNAEFITVVTAEAVTKGQAAYQLAAGTFGVADANAAGKQQFRGIFMNDAASGQPVRLMVRGWTSLFVVTALNCDVPVYLSDTAGALADGAGTMSVIVGRVTALPDGTKVTAIFADWLRAWS